MFGLVLWSALWIVLLCEWLPQRNETKFKKNIVLGVTLPKAAHGDPEVNEILEEYRKRLDRSCLLLTILSVAGAFLPGLTVSVICWSGMLLVNMGLPVVLFAVENRKLKAVKEKKGWKPEGKQPIRVDVSTMVEYPKPKLWGYLVCAILCGIPMAFQRQIWWLHLVSIGLVVMSYGCAVACYRKKSETVDADAALTRALSLLRYRKWKQVWMLSAASAVGISASFWLTELSVPVGMSLVLLSSLLLGGAVMGLEMQTRKLQEKLTAESGTDWIADEDDCWLWGQFYYNPHDSHMMVNARTGVGTTVNLASTGGKLLTGFTALVLAGTLALLIGSGIADQSEITLGLEDETVFCENGGTRYEVELDEIEHVELLDELPGGMWRTAGVGGQHLLKGRFSSGAYPVLRVLADPTNPPFLVIETESGTDYLFSARDPAVTEELFRALQNAR